jgi:DHA1 family bicyclomycin/chloramphenicol resistance-like MFS transporter
MTGTFLASRLVIRHGLERTIGLGALALLAGGLGLVPAILLQIESAVWVAACGAVHLAGLGLSLPQAQAGALSASTTAAGTASSLVGVLQQGTGAVVGAAVGQLLGATAWPLAGGLMLTGSVTLLLWATTRRVRRPG